MTHSQTLFRLTGDSPVTMDIGEIILILYTVSLKSTLRQNTDSQPIILGCRKRNDKDRRKRKKNTKQSHQLAEMMLNNTRSEAYFHRNEHKQNVRTQHAAATSSKRPTRPHHHRKEETEIAEKRKTE